MTAQGLLSGDAAGGAGFPDRVRLRVGLRVGLMPACLGRPWPVAVLRAASEGGAV
ncbi:hypothetical protein [Streptomyces sp. NPDC001508]|uniref:hypothetical protein n=1 Tax=Streptomyces sp. NPDC001508 TaxID=3154656 RepID=UPI00331E7BFA